jgi:uncharacterized protein (DUF2225 family)
LKVLCIFLILLAAAPAFGAKYKPKLVTCPVSGHDFFGLEIHAVNTLKHRDGDLLLRAEGGNQYATWIWTCPYCYFSARPEVFDEGTSVDFDPSSVLTYDTSYEAKESERLQLLVPPNIKYKNAAAYYFSVGKPPYFLGVLNLHASWSLRMEKVSTPEGLLGKWWKSYMKISKKGDPPSEEVLLLAIAEDLRVQLRAADEENRPKFELLIASTLRQAGEHKQAIPMLKKMASNTELGAIARAAAQELELAVAESMFQQEALRYFKEAIKFEETLPEDRLQSVYLVGELSRRLGDYDQARVWFEKAAETPLPQRWARRIMERQRRRLEEDMAAG